MADSDDEQEKGRSRDKFRRERSDYASGSDKGRSRGDYREKRWRDDSDYSSRRRSREDYESDNRRRFSGGSGYGRGGRDWSPPKRMRREQWTGFPVPGMMMPYGMRPPWSMPPHSLPPAAHHQMSPGTGLSADSPVMGGVSPHGPSRHTMLTFKQFLTQQEDDIEETDAITSYNDYKDEFKKKLMEEFFEEHKEEDWFISKYHPKNVNQSKEVDAANLQSRVKAFLFLLDSGLIDSVPISMDNSEDIVKMMDSAVIKMEGGSDLDLISLEQPQEGEDGRGDQEDKEKDQPPSFLTMEQTDEAKKLAEQAKEYMKSKKDSGKKKSKSSKKDGTYSYENENDSSSDDEADGHETGGEETADEPPPPGMETEPLVPSSEPATEDSGSALPETGQPVEAQSESVPAPPENGVKQTTPRPLHLTHSVYIRHIPPKISSEDIVEVCRTVPGFLRVAFAEPTPEKGYERRGWVTYSNETDIKDVLSRLSTKKIKDCQLNCIQNRDLTRRAKHSPTAVWTRKAIQTDLQLVLKLIKFFDEKTELWEHASTVQPGTGEGEATHQTNPVLSFPESLLSEEGEEPVSMVTSGDDEEGAISDPATDIMENSNERMKLLDRLQWYLRLVHSLDYYSVMVFPMEDTMPHRCGIFTIRTARPSTVNHDDVTEYVESMEAKVKPLLEKKQFLSESQMQKFGKKDPEAEAKRFVELNTQMISESKYLCPLSGKKFKGPEFVRKHIFNKHMDKVDAFKQEAEFFNSYIRDPDRPMPQETTIGSAILTSATPKTPGADESPTGSQPGMLGSSGGPWDRGAGMGMFGRGGFGPSIGGFTPDMVSRGGGGFRPPRGGRRGRGRRVVNYQDLDAPEEMY